MIYDIVSSIINIHSDTISSTAPRLLFLILAGMVMQAEPGGTFPITRALRALAADAKAAGVAGDQGISHEITRFQPEPGKSC